MTDPARPSDPVSRWLVEPRQSRNRRKNPLWRIRRILLLLAMAGVAALSVTIMLLSQIELPDTTAVAELSETSFICTAEVQGTCTRELAAAKLNSGEDRELVEYEQIPAVVINAIVATEDKDYFVHRGVDPVGITRALYQDIRERSAAQGGSTITQQYIKNAFLTPDRTLVRKVREATLAIKLERELADNDRGIDAKQEILRRYLNLIYFGRGAYGIEAAAQAYFGKEVERLTLTDAAYLAGLIRSPGGADATENPDEAERRRSTVLTRMLQDGYISQAEADRANQAPLGVIAPIDRQGLGVVKGSEVGTEYFIEAVRRQLADLYPGGALYTEGLRVYTTLDPDLQRAAYETATNELPPLDPESPAASLVTVDSLGRVVAMVGGTDFSTSEVNLALGRRGGGSGRQPGSSFKPFVLAEALEQGLSAKSLYEAPSSIILEGANNGADWRVKGGGSPKGFRDLADAMRVSSNVVFAQLMLDVTPQAVVQMAGRLGVSAELEPVNALVLGAGEVSVLDMANAYSTFERGGQTLAPVLIERIEDSEGNVICWYPPIGAKSVDECQSDSSRTPEQVLDRRVSEQVTATLESVVEGGTGRAAQIGRPAAGKTGTTQDARDAWFVGFTCDLTTAVWMGYAGAPGEPLRTMSNFRGIEVHGGDFPAEMWSTYMTKATATRPACASLESSSTFTGRIQNPELSTTTLPDCLPVPEPVEGATTVVDPAAQPTTTVECAPPTSIEGVDGVDGVDGAAAPDGESTTTAADTTVPTTTPTTVPETTTTTTDPPTTPTTAESGAGEEAGEESGDTATSTSVGEG